MTTPTESPSLAEEMVQRDEKALASAPHDEAASCNLQGLVELRCQPFTMMPLRVATNALLRRPIALGVAAPRPTTLALYQRATMATTVPHLGTEAEMTKEAIEQIRARVNYQKELMKAKGHTVEEDVSEMWRWLNITFWVALPVCAASALYSIFFDVHPHRVDGELPDYMHVRSKEFPWECGDCDLFDLACWRKCRAEKS